METDQEQKLVASGAGMAATKMTSTGPLTSSQDHLKQFVEQLAESQLQGQLKPGYPGSLLVGGRGYIDR